MLAAGVDTSIVTTEWGMSELIRNPQVLQKLTSELDAVVGKDRMVQETDIPNLKYLQAFIKEVFRLHPPTPLLLPHESIQVYARPRHGSQPSSVEEPTGV
jgi:cytochrome P450